MNALTLIDRDASTLRAYIETGERLLAIFRSEGFYAQLQLHADNRLSTIVIFASGMPPAVRAVMECRDIAHDMIDFHDDECRTVATWKVVLSGHDLSVVSVKFHAVQEATQPEVAP